MKPEWIEYTGSDEQIEEIANAKAGWIVRYEDCTESQIEYGEPKDMECPTHYLICQPHPLADMICQQARTGQPVLIKIPLQNDYTLADGTLRIGDVLVVMGKYYCIIETHFPNWNIPGAKYSFTPFEEEV